MPFLPALQSGKRVLFALRATDLDQWMLGGAALGGLYSGRLTALLLVVGWPGGVTQTIPLVTA
jgi:hypothetical protein